MPPCRQVGGRSVEMTERSRPQTEQNFPIPQPSDSAQREAPTGGAPACPVCGGRLFEIRAKLHCSQCHTICETCCEGGPG
ncbi:MAG TPA: hypothetical protein DDY91_10420 [Planctomycetaceae bacterium]|nr:hypothetical protein [Planctomycetaceae bacterium]